MKLVLFFEFEPKFAIRRFKLSAEESERAEQLCVVLKCNFPVYLIEFIAAEQMAATTAAAACPDCLEVDAAPAAA